MFRRSEAFERQLAETGPFHVVMSDMAPQTTGTKFTDQARSLELCLEALAVAEKYLVKGGSFVVKIFMGPDVGELLKGNVAIVLVAADIADIDLLHGV